MIKIPPDPPLSKGGNIYSICRLAAICKSMPLKVGLGSPFFKGGQGDFYYRKIKLPRLS
jgi:hypothetical protein